MTLRIWAIKLAELRQLPHEGLLLLGARCAMRVEPWMPPNIGAIWSRGLEHVMASAFSESDPGAALVIPRQLSDLGASAYNRMSSVDEALGRCMNYTTQTLARAVDATTLDFGSPMKKVIIETAKFSASIAGVLAHAGRVNVLPGGDAVAVACVAMWDAIRADVPVLAARSSDFKNADDRVRAVRDCAPLWAGEVPGWATPNPLPAAADIFHQEAPACFGRRNSEDDEGL